MPRQRQSDGYNDNVAALNWEVINHKQDIGFWKLAYDNKVIKGIGFENFIKAATSLSEDINVIYVNHINSFIRVSQNFIDYSREDIQYFMNGKADFLWVQFDNIELRNWKKILKNTNDEVEFVEKIDLLRDVFKGNCVNRLGLKNHFKYTLSSEMWKYICERYYLRANWARDFCKTLLPQDEMELQYMQKLNRASFYYCNEANFDMTLENLHSYDISSSHASFLIREKFPSSPFKSAETEEEINKVLYNTKDVRPCYHGLFYFQNLQYRTPFHFELASFGMPEAPGSNNWFLFLTNVDLESWVFKIFHCDSWECQQLYYADQKELSKDYAKMIDSLYTIKSGQEPETFAKDISKFNLELPFGQSIKRIDYDFIGTYDQETEEFVLRREQGKTFKEIQRDLVNRGMPYYVGLWVAAYSRREEIEMIYNIGFDNVVYGDTDSVKFFGDEGIRIIEKRNRDIAMQFRLICGKRNMSCNMQLGQWCKEEDIKRFKAVGIKWYLTENYKGELDVKAAGANNDVLLEYLNNLEDPFSSFSRTIEVPNLRGEARQNSPLTKHSVYVASGDSLNTYEIKSLRKKGTNLPNYIDEQQEAYK